MLIFYLLDVTRLREGKHKVTKTLRHKAFVSSLEVTQLVSVGAAKRATAMSVGLAKPSHIQLRNFYLHFL